MITPGLVADLDREIRSEELAQQRQRVPWSWGEPERVQPAPRVPSRTSPRSRAHKLVTRKLALRHLRRGKSCVEVARLLDLPAGTVRCWQSRYLA